MRGAVKTTIGGRRRLVASVEIIAHKHMREHVIKKFAHLCVRANNKYMGKLENDLPIESSAYERSILQEYISKNIIKQLLRKKNYER